MPTEALGAGAVTGPLIRGIAMSLTLTAAPLPLQADEDGSIWVGGTRVLLEFVIHAYQDGATPEQIVERYDSLELADVHAVIAYYLRHRREVGEYLARREAEAQEIRRRIEAGYPPRVSREELLARWASRPLQ